MVEVGQHIGTSAVQGASELGEFVEAVRHAGADRVDDLDQPLLATATVVGGVGVDDVLVDPPRERERQTPLVGEDRPEAATLPVAEQLLPDAGGAANTVERIP